VVRLSSKPWSYFILAGSLLVILLVQVLPSVDLPDTAFQRDTEPAEIQSQATALPTVVLAPLNPSLFFPARREFHSVREKSSTKPEHESILIFQHLLRC
jgi:hypothetical protein